MHVEAHVIGEKGGGFDGPLSLVGFRPSSSFEAGSCQSAQGVSTFHHRPYLPDATGVDPYEGFPRMTNIRMSLYVCRPATIARPRIQFGLNPSPFRDASERGYSQRLETRGTKKASKRNLLTIPSDEDTIKIKQRSRNSSLLHNYQQGIIWRYSSLTLLPAGEGQWK